MEITAQMVSQLRSKTGAGMMECKKALVECEGDIDKAVDVLRVRGKAGAEKRAARAASEGVAVAAVHRQCASLVELNCETDFVAKNDEFREIARTLANLAASEQVETREQLLSCPLADGRRAQQGLDDVVTKLRENIVLRRSAILQADRGSFVEAYVHTVTHKIAVIIKVAGDPSNPEHTTTARNIAMHIAAAKPDYVDRSQVPPETIAHEKEVLAELTRNEGKPEAAIPKIVEGRLGKYFERVCLVDQPYVREPAKTVQQVCGEAGIVVQAFLMYLVGQD